ncbi:FAD binding domain-containing protein [Coprinopsis sp. MPI-PUGE-AT-0042]|nr:FAD binding domain-containing protein [Coprinopsis sp. MPI-PUGE-AT-0042]
MASNSVPPEHASVLVIGGGPAGAYAASALAREGIDVTLLEAGKFPRYHIGESLIPSVRHYLRFIGAEDKLAAMGFVRKPGSAIKFNQYKREGYTDFVALGCENNAWNVVRSEFDLMLLNHARSCGVSVYEQTRVESIDFSSTDPSRPVSVSWSHTAPPPPLSPPASPKRTTFSLFGGSRTPTTERIEEPRRVRGITRFTHLIDATGRAGVLSTRYLKNRRFNASLKNIAVWGYWRDVDVYGRNTPREGAPWFEALTDESGWAWFIPLHNGTTSVGVVMNEKTYNSQIQNTTGTPSSLPHGASDSTLASRYLSSLPLAPGVVKLITQSGILEVGSVKSASDFSYSANSYAGPGYRIIGDAGAFIDPFFSSGVHLAMTSALSAAATICASLRHQCSESEAALWHTRRVSTSYTRFQIVVLSAYKQIRAQSDSVLCDVDEESFDQGLSRLRPVIQGASEMGSRLSEMELQKSLDFCINLFNPTTPEQHQRVAQKQASQLLDVAGPIVDPVTLRNAAKPSKRRSRTSGSDSDTDSQEETEMVLNKINARRVIHSEYYVNNLELEALEGMVVILEQGRLGLRSATTQLGHFALLPL